MSEQYVGVQDAIRVQDGKVYSVAEQELPMEYWRANDWARSHNPKHGKCAEFHHIGSIPAIFVHKWLMQGFDIFRASKKEIFKKLYDESLTDFIVTEKRVI